MIERKRDRECRQVGGNAGAVVFDGEVHFLAQGGGVATHREAELAGGLLPGGVPGDRVRVGIRKRKRSDAEGVIEEELTPSDLRTDPRCEYFGTCGGCKWQHVQYDAQLDAKLHRVHQTTDEKIARLEQLDARITAAAKQFGHALADGRIIQRDLTASVENAQAIPTNVTQQLERFDDHLAAYQTMGRDAFAAELDRMKESLLGEMAAELGQQRMHLDTELAEAHAIAQRIMERHDYVGVLTVELYEFGEDSPVGPRLMANEIAPRVHNSGHR